MHKPPWPLGSAFSIAQKVLKDLNKKVQVTCAHTHKH